MTIYSFLKRKKARHTIEHPHDDTYSYGASGMEPVKNDLTNLRTDDKMESVIISYVDETGSVKKKNVNRAKKNLNQGFDAKYMGLGYYLAAPLISGVVIGILTDNWLNTKPYFTLGFIIFGTVATFYNLYKLLKEDG